MTHCNGNNRFSWQPMNEDAVEAIEDLFSEIFPEAEYGDLAEKISDYWVGRLEETWKNKDNRIKQKDLSFNPNDPLSRILPATVVISYPDSVYQKDEATLETLERFLDRHFPFASGLHVLPACQIVEDRFNDGYFSQVKRDVIHKRFGTNKTFSRLMEKYFSMADFVLNHVDIENPKFRAYLEGDDDAGDCFYVFSEKSYKKLSVSGAFDNVFRPRPFPLFTIFRRTPEDDLFAQMDLERRCAAVNEILAPDFLDEEIIKILTIFDKIKNDQVLLEDDYQHITGFLQYIEKMGISWQDIFRLSKIQESTNPPYIFRKSINTRADLLMALGLDTGKANHIAGIYEEYDHAVFGEQIRAWTTFSHVQVDVNTSGFEGLKMLADDFSWYLSMDINMLRLDAANYAFKKFHTSCFGLSEVKKLMHILRLSMECVSPRTIANLEINDTLDTILSQMSDKDAPPQMMYDFHLPCILPVVFNTQNTKILDRIFKLINRYDIPKECIRFSLAESHDGKSVRGSMDLLSFSERWMLAETVRQNGGRIKYKDMPERRCSAEEFENICKQAGIGFKDAAGRLFKALQKTMSGELVLKSGIETIYQIFDALAVKPDTSGESAAIRFFADRMINGREPYELCCSTRDSLVRINDTTMEAERFVGFYTIAFALMGRNVKSVYFNDMAGLPNDHERMEKTGEYRDIKRTRSEYAALAEKITKSNHINGIISDGMESLIHIADNDPALCFRGYEAKTIFPGNPATAVVYNHFLEHCTLTVVNISSKTQTVNIDTSAVVKCGFPRRWNDLFGGGFYRAGKNRILRLSLTPYQRMWLKPVSASAS